MRLCLPTSPLRTALVTAALLGTAAGCKSAYETQLDKARADAVATGEAQQIISVSKDGTTTVAVVQPPATPGAAPVVTTTTTPAGAPLVAGQPDWSNGARPAPGNTVTFTGPRVARAQPAAPPTPPGEQSTGASAATATAPVVPGPVPAENIRTDVTIPAGTGLAIRMNQTISVKHSHAGDRFTGSLADAVAHDGKAILPRGTRVNGVVTEAHRRGHFKGRSYLGLRLTSIAYQGKTYPITTGSLLRTKKGKGKRSTAFIGTGAGVGMLVGGVATGGVGLLVGGLAGGGLGTVLGGLTGNRDLDIPAESLVRFRLEDSLVVQPAE